MRAFAKLLRRHGASSSTVWLSVVATEDGLTVSLDCFNFSSVIKYGFILKLGLSGIKKSHERKILILKAPKNQIKYNI